MKEITVSDCEYMEKRGFFAIVENGKVVAFVRRDEWDD